MARTVPPLIPSGISIDTEKEQIFFYSGSTAAPELKDRSLGEGSIRVLPVHYFDKETGCIAEVAPSIWTDFPGS